MTSLQWIALIERVLIFAVGLGFGWMGYRLLYAGLYQHAAQVKESSAEQDLLWKQVLPGVTFAIFAGVVIVSILYQPSVAVTLAGLNTQTSDPGSAAPLPEGSTIDLSEQSEKRPRPAGEAGYLDNEFSAHPLEGFGPIPESGSMLAFPEAGSGL